MKNKYGRKMKAAALAAVLALETVAAPALTEAPSFFITSYAEIGTGFVNTDRLNVRSGPGTGYGKVTTLGAGTTVQINSETTGSDGYTWYAIGFGGGSGYARYDYISRNVTYAAQSADFENWLNQQGFPESYKNGLRGLHQQYPNWVFKAMQTGLDWNTVIAEESKITRNLVDKNSISSWKSIADGAFDWAGNYWPGFDGATWVQASTELISYYMDPRNFLTDPYIFQFEQQSYDPSIQTRDGLEKLVAGTFLAGDAIVPVEGSQIEGGTIIEGSTYSGGVMSGVSGSSSGGTSYGPGGGSTGSYTVIGPGGTVTSTGSASSSGSSSGSGPGGGVPYISVTGPGGNYSFLDSVLDRLTGVITSYAAKWRHEQEPAVRWVYVQDDGTYLTDGWYWLDGNNDGIAECYYFYSDGTMAADTVVEGYPVNADGKWIHGNGEPYTKTVAVTAGLTTTDTAVSPAAAGSSSGLSADGPSPAGETSGMALSGTGSTGELKKVSYVDIIMKAAETSGVSPYVLASAILQEQGRGTSDLISGTHSQYPGYYNFYNTGAYAHDGMSAVEAGLKYASESGNGGRPWNTIEKAIIGGASAYAASYVAQGQDTFYLKKFNVQGSNKFNHQFMTHVLGAAAEGAKVSAAYSDAVKAGTLEFKIPVYLNMPGDPCPLPATDGNPNNKLRSLSVDGYVITPTFQMDTTEYSLIVDGSSSYVNIQAQTIDSGATVSGAGQVGLNVGNNDISIVVRAQNGSERTYHLNITRKEGSDGSGVPYQIPADNASYNNAAGSGYTVIGPGGQVVSSGASGSGSLDNTGNAAGPGAVIQNSTEGTVYTDSNGVIIGAGPQ